MTYPSEFSEQVALANAFQLWPGHIVAAQLADLVARLWLIPAYLSEGA